MSAAAAETNKVVDLNGKAKPAEAEEAIEPFEFEWVDIGHCFDNEPPPLDFVLPGFLAGTVGGLVSPGGVGKSTWALEAAMELAMAGAGGDLVGLGVEKFGRVVILAGEDPQIALWHRLKSMSAVLSPDAREAVRSNLHIAPCVGKNIDLTAPRYSDAMLHAADGCRMMVIDTLTRFHSKDENAAADAKEIMGRLEYIAEQTGCAIMYLHHVNKAAAMNGLTELAQAARGSSVFVDNARWLSFIAGMTEDEAIGAGISIDDRSNYVRWNISKMNYSQKPDDSWYVRSAGGVLLPVEIEVRRTIRRKKSGRGGRNESLI